MDISQNLLFGVAILVGEDRTAIIIAACGGEQQYKR
jgi:hypothetical protein